jgi:hypothetical protein
MQLDEAEVTQNIYGWVEGRQESEISCTGDRPKYRRLLCDPPFHLAADTRAVDGWIR